MDEREEGTMEGKLSSKYLQPVSDMRPESIPNQIRIKKKLSSCSAAGGAEGGGRDVRGGNKRRRR